MFELKFLLMYKVIKSDGYNPSHPLILIGETLHSPSL